MLSGALMNQKQLEYFISVAEELSFTRAAKHHFISQAALSQQIRALEREVGTKLFVRDNHHVALTVAGVGFLEDAQAIVARSAQAVERARQADDSPEGELRIGYVKGYERTNLPDMLFEFHSKYPRVRLGFMRENVSELYDALRAERVDIAINLLYLQDQMNDIQTQILRHYPLYAVVPASHPFSTNKTITMKELAPYPLVDIHKGAGDYGEGEVISQTLEEIGLPPHIAYVSEDVETSILAVASGMGYALLPGYFTETLPPDGKVRAIPIAEKETEMIICAAWMPERKNDLIDIFLDDFLRVD